MKHAIYSQLTFLRDKDWLPEPVRIFVDWLRYDVFYPYDEIW